MPIGLTTLAARPIGIAAKVPRHLRPQYLQRLAELLPPEYGDGDLWRAAHKAQQELLGAR
jgi:hypothetical protein